MESSSTLANKSKPRRRRKPKSICLPFAALPHAFGHTPMYWYRA